MVKKAAVFFKLFGAVILLVGAIYMALSYQAYAIAGCFFAAAILLLWGNLLPNKNNSNSKPKE